MVVPVALTKLAGERNSPELPVPMTAIRDYAERFGFSSVFVHLVHEYDTALMSSVSKQRKEQMKNGGAQQITA